MVSGCFVSYLLTLIVVLVSMQVSSQNKHGTLLEVVQELMDMDLTISKAYISSDGGWFMDGKLLVYFIKLVADFQESPSISVCQEVNRGSLKKKPMLIFSSTCLQCFM